MKTNKSAGLDDIRTEEIKNFGHTTREWVVQQMNNCIDNMQIPKLWRKTRVMAILKPVKESNEAKKFRPISLFWILKIWTRKVSK